MTNKKPEKSLSERFEEEIRQELASGQTSKPSLDEFKVLVYKDRAKRRRKRTTIAAGIILALLAGFFALEMCVDDVGADKNPKEEIITEDGVIIEDGGWGSSEEEDNVFVIEEWEYIEDAKLISPKVLMPDYVPNKYMFDKLVIETIVKGDVIYKYTFLNNHNDDTLLIEVLTTKGESTVTIENPFKTIKLSKGTIYIHSEEKKATMLTNDGIMISVWANISEEEFIKIMKGLVD